MFILVYEFSIITELLSNIYTTEDLPLPVDFLVVFPEFESHTADSVDLCLKKENSL